MKLTIVYDNDVYRKDIGLKSDWGFSCLIETGEETILFDTGAKGRLLLYNMKKLDIDPSSINKIVISHEHWDHNGGLESLIAFVVDAELYRLGAKSPSGKIELTTVEEPQNIATNVWTTGRLNGKILGASRQFGNIVGLIGGLHGFDDFSILEDLEVVCPAHCTKHKKKIYEFFPKTSVECGVGKIIEI